MTCYSRVVTEVSNICCSEYMSLYFFLVVYVSLLYIVTVQPLKSKKQQQELIHSSQVALELTISIDSSQP